MFFYGERRFMALKTLRWQGDDGYKFALPLEHFEGHRPSCCKRKIYPLARGIVHHQSNSSDQDDWHLLWR
jgi:hypothetical protein